MKRTFLFSFLFFVVMCVYSQTESSGMKKNSVYAEYRGGSLAPLGIHYDRILFELDNWYIDLSAGIGFGANFIPTESWFSIPVSLNFTSHKKFNNHFEGGFGIARLRVLYEEKKESVSYSQLSYGEMLYHFHLAYKYQRPNGGLFFKLSVFPLNSYTFKDVQHWMPINMNQNIAGIALGYTF